MRLLQIIWNYIPALVTLGVLAVISACHAEEEYYEDCIEREVRLGGAVPYLTKTFFCVDYAVVKITSRPEFWIE